ncbi:MAG: DNA-processing protein DprA [Candidatus Falkowbacteria bacterium]
MLQIDNKQALLAFSCFAKFGPTKILLLENYFGSASSAYFASSFGLERIGLKTKLINEFIEWRNNFNINNEEEKLRREGIQYISWHDNSYPPLLHEIHSAPYIIYYKGNIELLNSLSKRYLAIVGSRKHSAYAEKIIKSFLPILISENIIIISGLALGVDSLAHKETLANKGVTVAVLGSGLDDKNIYPSGNKQLAKVIVKLGGLLISEFPQNTPPLRQNFPQRNRIISGLTQATLIIEANLKSGSLITANYALDQNRDVLAIPGNIFSECSAGANNLIKLGARPISSSKDILDYFDISVANSTVAQRTRKMKLEFNDESEELIYQLIKSAHERGERITSDEIVNISKLDTAVTNSKLSILELRGVANCDGISYDIN